ncbi:hypothetical protein, partial [Alistipes sp. CHKCI003]|uniref:hypothetical protein n=1 Tax=Alistipes sp. CHKCI003 TaxID=1780376 RepID=UPI001CD6E0B2
FSVHFRILPFVPEASDRQNANKFVFAPDFFVSLRQHGSSHAETEKYPPPKNYDKLLITRVLRPHHTLSSPTAGRDFSHPYRPIFFNLSNNILKNKHHGKKL